MIHIVFDPIASATAFQAIRLTHGRLGATDDFPALQPRCAMALGIGAVIGACGLGALNRYLTHLPGIGRSIGAALIGPLNLFHLTCAALLIYAALMIRKPQDV